MEKTNMKWQMRPGVNFVPTDAELISYYLYPRALGSDRLIDFISNSNVYADAPWQLPGIEGMQNTNDEREDDDGQQWHYFFTETKRRSENRADRIAGDGFWRATTIKKKIYRQRTEIIGWTRQLNYYSFNDNGRRSSKNATKTKWIMREYGLDDPQFQHWKICKIRINERKRPLVAASSAVPPPSSPPVLQQQTDV